MSKINSILYGIISDGHIDHLYTMNHLYVALPYKAFKRILIYSSYWSKLPSEMCWTDYSNHALNSLSRGAWFTRMKRVTTYKICLIEESEYLTIIGNNFDSLI